jgi:TetR/AcrR family transcriptional regulator
MKANSQSTIREERTRAEILAATKRLVIKHGLHKVTMEDIASALGKRKGFLYYYYPGRTEIIRAVLCAEFATLRQQVREAVNSEKRAQDRLRAFVKTRIEMTRAQAAVYGPATVMSVAQGAEPGTDFASFLEIRKSFDLEEAEFLKDLLRQGVREGAFRAMSAKALDELARFLLSAMRGIELELLFDSEQQVSPQETSRMLDIFLRGLST